jgi:uncharacterized protein (DUF1501 family)
MKRRDFFKISAPLLSTPVLLNSTTVSAFNSFDLFNMLDCTKVRDRFVVMVQLKGANDGLNTVIRPENDGLYQTHRNDIYIPQNTLFLNLPIMQFDCTQTLVRLEIYVMQVL